MPGEGVICGAMSAGAKDAFTGGTPDLRFSSVFRRYYAARRHGPGSTAEDTRLNRERSRTCTQPKVRSTSRTSGTPGVATPPVFARRNVAAPAEDPPEMRSVVEAEAHRDVEKRAVTPCDLSHRAQQGFAPVLAKRAFAFELHAQQEHGLDAAGDVQARVGEHGGGRFNLDEPHRPNFPACQPWVIALQARLFQYSMRRRGSMLAGEYVCRSDIPIPRSCRQQLSP